MEVHLAYLGLAKRPSFKTSQAHQSSYSPTVPADSFRRTTTLKFKGAGQQFVTPKLQREAAIVAHAAEKGAKTFAEVSVEGAKVLMKATGVILAESAEGGQKLFHQANTEVEKLIAPHDDPRKAPLLTIGGAATVATVSFMTLGPVTIPAAVATLSGYNYVTSNSESQEQPGVPQTQGVDEFEMIGDRQPFTAPITTAAGFPSVNPFVMEGANEKPAVQTTETDKNEADLDEVPLDSRPPSTRISGDLAMSGEGQIIEGYFPDLSTQDNVQAVPKAD